MHRMGSGGRVWNEEGGGAFRFKSIHRSPITQEWNVCTEVNVAREDEAEQARSQAGRPRVSQPAPTLSGVGSVHEPWLRD